MQLAFIYGKQPSSTLTKLFTGSTCYHVGFTDGEWFWDMHKHRRVGAWKGRYSAERVILVDCPVPVTSRFLDDQVLDQTVEYGFRDYIAFAFRWAYHLVGKSTRNFGGEICSEWVANVLIALGWPKHFAEVPSPADLELALLGRRDAIICGGCDGLGVRPGADGCAHCGGSGRVPGPWPLFMDGGATPG